MGVGENIGIHVDIDLGTKIFFLIEDKRTDT